jgi:hypothetical protein
LISSCGPHTASTRVRRQNQSERARLPTNPTPQVAPRIRSHCGSPPSRIFASLGWDGKVLEFELPRITVARFAVQELGSACLDGFPHSNSWPLSHTPFLLHRDPAVQIEAHAKS